MTVKSIYNEFKRRHLNPKIKKAVVYGVVILSLAEGFYGYYNSLEAKTNAAMMKNNLVSLEKKSTNSNIEVERLTEANTKLLEENNSLKYQLEELRREVNRGYSANAMDFEITAYDLSVESCGKDESHPAYGLTATGLSLVGHTLESARVISVDPDIIPLGSKVKITFLDESAKQWNGIYTAADTGGAINGNRIDLFAGDGAHHLAVQIGRRKAKVEIL